MAKRLPRRAPQRVAPAAKVGRAVVVNVGLDRLDDALADTDRALELDPSIEFAALNREQILGMISLRDQQAG